MIEISRKAYCDMYGPTVGDRVRLGDTSLIAEVEKDLTVHGDEAKFGGGKSLRDGMGQSCKATDKECLDTVITNALIIDSTGIIKADVGIKDGRIAGIGKAGNPDIMNGVDKNMIIGASTEAIAGEGLILTAGGLDTHIPNSGENSPLQRNHHHDRRWYRSCRRHQCHHLYTWRVQYPQNVGSLRRPANEFRLSLQGKFKRHHNS